MKAFKDMQKDIKEAVESRISAPYFGYIFLAFISINWKYIVYMLFAKTDILERIQFVESRTNYLEGLFLPIAIGAILTFISPWLKLWFTMLAAKPTIDLEILGVESLHRLTQARINLHSAEDKEKTLSQLKTAEEMLRKAQEEVEQRNQELAHSEKELESVKKSEVELANQRFEDKKKIEALTLEVQDLSKQNNALTKDFITMKNNLTEKNNELEELKQQNQILRKRGSLYPASMGLTQNNSPEKPEMIRR